MTLHFLANFVELEAEFNIMEDYLGLWRSEKLSG